MLFVRVGLQIDYKKLTMATFTICIRSTKIVERPVPVFIRITHQHKVGYLKTLYLASINDVKESNGSYEITENFILLECLKLIEEYKNKLNRTPHYDLLSCGEIVDILENKDNALSFTVFANQHINKMINEDRERSARNYRTALNSLINFYGKEDILFQELTTKRLNEWVESLSGTARAKNMYPTYMHHIFRCGMDEYNDYDLDIIRVPNEPFKKVKIPSEDVPQKRGQDSTIIRKFFEQEPFPSSQYGDSVREIIGYEVAKIIICLAGINAADLYDLRNESYRDGKLCYNRKKTRKERKNNAYMEISVPDMIKPLFEKYKGNTRLFNFSETYSMEENFSRAVSVGIKSICSRCGLPYMTAYSFRHSWASIARNECKVSMDDVAFSLNHASAHNVTDGYVKEDFTRVDKINKKVINKIFKKIPATL